MDKMSISLSWLDSLESGIGEIKFFCGRKKVTIKSDVPLTESTWHCHLLSNNDVHAVDVRYEHVKNNRNINIISPNLLHHGVYVLYVYIVLYGWMDFECMQYTIVSACVY